MQHSWVGTAEHKTKTVVELLEVAWSGTVAVVAGLEQTGWHMSSGKTGTAGLGRLEHSWVGIAGHRMKTAAAGLELAEPEH